jgi:hypothetical protein
MDNSETKIESKSEIKKSFHDWLNEENEAKRADGQSPVVVLDPDGLDRSSPANFDKDFRENLITKKEFYYKLSLCTLLSQNLFS